MYEEKPRASVWSNRVWGNREHGVICERGDTDVGGITDICGVPDV